MSNLLPMDISNPLAGCMYVEIQEGVSSSVDKVGDMPPGLL